MAQIQKGYEYDSTIPTKNVVTDANLNSLVANATLLNGAIAEQFPNSSTADSDLMLLSKGGSLIKQTKGQFTDIINSNTINVNTLSVQDSTFDDIEVVDAVVSNDLSVGGDTALTGNLAVEANIEVAGNVTIAGTTNVNGAFNVDGIAVNLLFEIVDETIPAYTSIAAGITNNLHTTSVFTKPAGETWIMEISLRHQGYAGYTYEFAGRYGTEPVQTGSYLFYERRHDGAGGGALTSGVFTHRWVVPSATTFTSQTIRIDTNSASGSGLTVGTTSGNAGSLVSGTVQASKFRIYKYKNA